MIQKFRNTENHTELWKVQHKREKKGLNMNGGLITPQETGGSIKKKQPSTGEENQRNRGKARQEIKMTHGT